MKTSWKTELILFVLIAGMFLASAWIWPTAPDRVPTHWGLDGDVNGYGGRFEGLLLMPLIALFLYVTMRFLPRIDPGRLNYERFAGAYTTIRIAPIVFLAILHTLVVLYLRGVRVDMARFAGIGTGAMFVIIGNVLGKVRPNWFFGVRTPWTLSSKRSWIRTHRMAGWVLVLGGFAFMIAGVTRNEVVLFATIALLAAGVIASLVYSYFVWKSDPDRVPPAGTLPGDDDASTERIRPSS